MKQRNKQQQQQRRHGFTLLEVLLVLAIIGVIAAMVIPNLLGTQQRAMVDQTKIAIKNLESQLRQYAQDHNGVFPESVDDLINAVDRDGNQMAAYIPEPIKDAWGKPLNYQKPEAADERGIYLARVWSNGPNGQDDDGSPDDVNNWDKPENQNQ